MYDVSNYGHMIQDKIRTDAHLAVLRRNVKPDSTVLDIGTGTGLWALEAARLGARMVYAVDPNPAVEVARSLAAANGLADRIRFLQMRSDYLTVPEPVDGMISDIRGPLPLIPDHLAAVIDARERLLKPGGWQCSRRDTLYFALLHSPRLYSHVVGPYWKRPDSFDFSCAQRWVINRIASYVRHSNEHATPPQCLGTLDYRSVTDRNFHSKVSFVSEQTLVVHGAVVWFEADLAEGIGYTTSPFAEKAERAWIYGNAFLPFQYPLALEPGDSMTFEYRALDTLQGYHYYWCCSRDRNEIPRQERKQSTFLGTIFTANSVRRQSERFVPVLSEDARIARHLLNLVGEGRTNGDLARSLMESFPERFQEYSGCLSYVASFCNSQSL